MAGVTNIAGGADQFNRYKMPTLIAKVEGKGNGIKTRIVNLAQVGRSLHRRAGYICKFFGCELGAQTKDDDANNVYIVNGAHSGKDLGDILQKFINMFVLCENCKLPETDLKVRKNGDIVQKCNACGCTSMCDATHKLCTFIKNNPPNGKGGKGGKGSKEERRKKKGKKPSLKERNEGVSDGKEDVENGGNGLVVSGKEDSTVVDDFGQDQTLVMLPGDDLGGLDDLMGEMADFGAQDDTDENDDVHWSVDTSKEAQEARKKEIGDAAKILERATISDEKEGKVKKLRAYIDDGKKPSKVLSKSEKFFGPEASVAGIMDAVIFDEAVGTIPTAVKEKAVVILKHVDDLGQKLAEWIDTTCESDDKVPKVTAHILKTFYDEDAISEDDVLTWYNGDGSTKARECSKEFVEWLQESDEESESGEDE
eukprot:Plantae.Rhodophyta-Hildenbrandia_rubra.ctg13.p1 GENE.Plantae.Rhodophyta-Hildenbrandia_rubra.ctg13~~Plantae.Rhodophyta-Hildenbrandia_rubra.ctg13.p1  ORF type:complete len:424 (-),score=127.96 Plantae.Rhodophyta-Hildenbrandia_rubra.ctg13:2931-4202(-)